MEKTYLISGAVFIFTSILLGAFGSHILRPLVPESTFFGYSIATNYLVFQGLGLLILGVCTTQYNFPHYIFHLLFWGTLIFSGSIYLLTIGKILDWNLRFIGPITPIGGIVLLLAWASIFYHFVKL